LAEELCYNPPPADRTGTVADADLWGALLTARTLQENDSDGVETTFARNQTKLTRKSSRRWLHGPLMRDHWMKILLADMASNLKKAISRAKKPDSDKKGIIAHISEKCCLKKYSK
jgi:hypothetical protein